MPARSHSTIRKMQPGTFGGQSRVATPVSPANLVQPTILVLGGCTVATWVLSEADCGGSQDLVFTAMDPNPLGLSVEFDKIVSGFKDSSVTCYEITVVSDNEISQTSVSQSDTIYSWSDVPGTTLFDTFFLNQFEWQFDLQTTDLLPASGTMTFCEGPCPT